MKLFPNPVSDRLNVVNLANESVSYEIFSASGVQLRNGILQADTSKVIQLNDLASGLYFLKSDRGSVKFIITR